MTDPIIQLETQLLDQLSKSARGSVRLRMHRNLHALHSEPCQRLLNALEPQTYIRPHRHALDPKVETLVALRGLFALICFNNDGTQQEHCVLGSELYSAHQQVVPVCAAVEIPPSAWHTVIALTAGAVLFEVKAGPFDERRPKELASWAPEEGTPEAISYLLSLTASLSATVRALAITAR